VTVVLDSWAVRAEAAVSAVTDVVDAELPDVGLVREAAGDLRRT
jgi:hypothetical protein